MENPLLAEFLTFKPVFLRLVFGLLLYYGFAEFLTFIVLNP